MKKIILWMIWVSAHAVLLHGAAYLPWNDQMELWMPTGWARPALPVTPAQAASRRLPFDEPAMKFAPAPAGVKTPLNAQESLAYQMPYFFASNPTRGSLSVELKETQERVELGEVEGPLPEKLWAVKSLTDLSLLADWPKEALPATQLLLQQKVAQLLKDAPTGTYALQVVWQ